MRTAVIASCLLGAVLLACGDDFGGVDDTGSSSADDTAPPGTDSIDGADATIGAEGTSSDHESTSVTPGETTSADTDPGNAQPEANDDVYYLGAGRALVVDATDGALANDVDADADPLTISAADTVSHQGGTVEIGADGSISYTPTAETWGADTFGYTVSDGTATAIGRVTVHVVPSHISLANLTEPSQGFFVEGEGPNAAMGVSVAAAGDVDGDGIDDVVVAGIGTDANGVDSGRTYVVFGTPDEVEVEPADIVAGAGGFAIDGEDSYQFSGDRVSGVGDVNGDGLADVIVGAPEWSSPIVTSAGRSYVVFGKADGDLVPLGDIVSGIGGFAIDGEAGWDYVGRDSSAAGDVNGDGLADVIVGGRGSDGSALDAGRSYVVFGKDDTQRVHLADVAEGIGGFAIDGIAVDDLLGEAALGIGDMNADGLDDVALGSFSADPNGQSSGSTYVVFGKTDTDLVSLSDVVAGSGGFAIAGEHAGDRSGRGVAGGGDIDGDGRVDLVVGSPRFDGNGTDSGRAYVVFGKADTNAVVLADVAMGIGGFVLEGEAAGEWAGEELAIVGDLDDDGLADLLVGARFSDFAGEDSGRVYVVYGRSDTDPVQLSDVAAGDGGFAIDGEAFSDYAGASVSGAGDVNHDGVPDLFIGATDAAGSESFIGRAYVLFGVPTGPR